MTNIQLLDWRQITVEWDTIKDCLKSGPWRVPVLMRKGNGLHTNTLLSASTPSTVCVGEECVCMFSLHMHVRNACAFLQHVKCVGGFNPRSLFFTLFLFPYVCATVHICTNQLAALSSPLPSPEDCWVSQDLCSSRPLFTFFLSGYLQCRWVAERGKTNTWYLLGSCWMYDCTESVITDKIIMRFAAKRVDTFWWMQRRETSLKEGQEVDWLRLPNFVPMLSNK